MAIEIPENLHKRDFEAEVDAAVDEVLKEMRRSAPNHRVGCLSVNHGCSHFHVKLDVANEVIARFKKKGYHAHYCQSLYGTAHTLEITSYPTDHDI